MGTEESSKIEKNIKCVITSVLLIESRLDNDMKLTRCEERNIESEKTRIIERPVKTSQQS